MGSWRWISCLQVALNTASPIPVPGLALFAPVACTVYNYSMRTEIQYKWRILWAGHWVTTGHHCTEEQIRKEHPEAVRIDHSRRELEVAETSDERRNFMFPM